MTLRCRKTVVIVAVGAVLLLANARVVVDWLGELGLIDVAVDLRQEFLTGTAITVILALVVLLVPGRQARDWRRWVGRCPVCSRLCLGRGCYCSVCGCRL